MTRPAVRSSALQMLRAVGLLLQQVMTDQPGAVPSLQMAGFCPHRASCCLSPLNIPCACLLQGKGHARPALRSVLLVGNPSLPLKGFDVAINALAAINQVLPLHVTWVCQNQPNATLVPTLTGSGLCISLYINPSQVSPSEHRGRVLSRTAVLPPLLHGAV